MSLGSILVVILLRALIGALPGWQYSSGWTYYPSGTVGLVLTVLIALLLTGRL